MEKLLFILSVSVGSIVAGYAASVALPRWSGVPRSVFLNLSRLLKLAAFFVLNPVAIVGTFWRMSLGSVRLAVYPLLGILSALVGAAAALAVNRALRLPPQKAASVFTSGMFSNLLTFGGLVGYVFFSEPGYLLAQLYNMLVSPVYYLVGYPVSNNIAKGASRVFRLDVRLLRRNPLLLVPPAAIAVGLILNVTGLARPAVMDPLIAVLVPTISGMLGVSIGFSLRVSKVREYRKEIGLVMLIKFVVLPAVMVPVGLLLGLNAIDGGLPFRMLVVLSAMPVAFNALVPPAIFGFDLDLANSAWIVTTASLVVIVPVLYVLLV